ncbi:MAG TPA: ChaB family protein [Chloroflexota bacterium]|nr:ChaB family protein [Chloroflexota bacterium]
MPGRQDMPSTIRRSDKRAQDIYVKTHDSAVEQYGEGERAHRTAFKSLKREYRKSGDHWVAKGNREPSDPQQAGNRTTHRMTAGGYDVGPGATVKTLRSEARELNIEGRSHMNKDQLRNAIMRKAGRKV